MLVGRDGHCAVRFLADHGIRYLASEKVRDSRVLELHERGQR